MAHNSIPAIGVVGLFLLVMNECAIIVPKLYVVDVERCVIISMVVMCNDIVIMECDGKRPGLPNAPVVMEHDNNRT